MRIHVHACMCVQDGAHEFVPVHARFLLDHHVIACLHVYFLAPACAHGHVHANADV